MKKEIKTVDAAGLAFITGLEGCILHPYRDKIGICTIGIGSTYYENGQRVTMSDPWISEARAKELFKHILAQYEKTVWSVTRDDITQNNFDSLVSICYNVGISGFKGSMLLALVNANPHDFAIRNAFNAWKYSGGKPLLLPRRIKEGDRYFLQT